MTTAPARERAKDARKPVFDWQDPLLLEDLLTEEERLVRDSARAFAQEQLMPRIKDAFREERVDRELLPELGRLNRRGIAALAGVAPFNHDSGSLHGQRKIAGGRPRLRRVLYAATVAAARCNPLLRPFYLRLRAAGKPPMVIIGAMMRKLVHVSFGVLKSGKPFNPALHGVGSA